jgi:hypothetical protein
LLVTVEMYHDEVAVGVLSTLTLWFDMVDM